MKNITLYGIIYLLKIDITPFLVYIITNMKLGKEIKKLRKNIGLTQVEFSKRVGVGLKFVRDLEQGKPTVRLDKVNQVLEFLGYHLEVTLNEHNAIKII